MKMKWVCGWWPTRSIRWSVLTAFTFPGVLRSVLLAVGHGHSTLLSGWMVHGARRGSTWVHSFQWNLRPVPFNERIILGQDKTTTTSDLRSMYSSTLQMLGRNACKGMFLHVCASLFALPVICFSMIYSYTMLLYCSWNLQKFTDCPSFRIMICTVMERVEKLSEYVFLSSCDDVTWCSVFSSCIRYYSAGGARRIGQRSHDRFSQEGGLGCERACQHMAFARRCSFSFKMLACIIWYYYQVSFVECFLI